MAAAISFVAERVRSVGVPNGASRLRRSSEVFVELRLFMAWFCLVSFQVVSLVHGKDDAEANFATVHSFVSLACTAERKLFNHRMHVVERAEFQSVLRIARGSGGPRGHRPRAGD